MKWLLVLALSLPFSAHAEELRYGNFGLFRIFRGAGEPRRLAIFLSDGEWGPGPQATATKLAGEHVVVAGINGAAYAKTLEARSKKCAYPAGDFELLSKFLQTKLKFKEYRPPVLVGEGSAASLVYGTMAQAPKATFAGAVSVGFCPDYRGKMFCKGYGLKSNAKKAGFSLEPFAKPLAGWVAIIGEKDRSCRADDVKAFAGKVEGARFLAVPGAARKFGDANAWLPSLSDAIAGIRSAEEKASPAPAGGDLADLPLVTVEPKGAARGLVVFYSGDGGWAGFDQELSAELANEGQRVVGLSTLKYFWSPKTPDGASADLAKIIRTYRAQGNQGDLRLVGYSFGADVLPELTARLPDDVRALVKGISLLGLSDRASFEFHFSDWVSDSGEGIPIAPTLKKVAERTKVQCLYGEDESDSLCARMGGSKVTVFKLPGGHHFDGNAEGLAKIILGK